MVESLPSLRQEIAVAPRKRAASEPPLVSVMTLVIWLSCVTVGTIGLVLPYARAQWAKKSEPPPVVAQLLQVELATETPPPSAPRPMLNPTEPPPLVLPPTAPPIVSMITVAEPSPQIAFAHEPPA